MDPRLARALVAWLIDRAPALDGRVRPNIEQPGGAGPWLTYTHVDTQRVGNAESRTGETATRVQIDVWSQDQAAGLEIAHLIAGTGLESDPSARGLDYHAGDWPDPADTGGTNPVVIQFCERLGGFNDIAPPTLGTETPWYRFSADYLITYEERF